MNKRSILFTVTTILLFLSLLLLAQAYKDRTHQLEEDATIRMTAEQLAYAEDDVISGVYRDLLPTTLHVIERGSTIILKFNLTPLSIDNQQEKMFEQYNDFIRSNYSLSGNLNITLINFNNSFRILPYDTLFVLNGSELTIRNPDYTDIVSVTVDVLIDLDNDTKWVNFTPSDSLGGLPITVTYYDEEGDEIYVHSAELPPTTDNDDVLGRQFYQSFTSGNASLGYIDTKFGLVNGATGIFQVRVVNITANITSLELEYTADPDRVILRGGNISIASKIGGIRKNTEIILAEE